MNIFLHAVQSYTNSTATGIYITLIYIVLLPISIALIYCIIKLIKKLILKSKTQSKKEALKTGSFQYLNRPPHIEQFPPQIIRFLFIYYHELPSNCSSAYPPINNYILYSK